MELDTMTFIFIERFKKQQINKIQILEINNLRVNEKEKKI